MDCPVCGEELPLNSSECEACGNSADGLFLTEEVKTSRAVQRTFDIPPEVKETAGTHDNSRAGALKRKLTARGSRKKSGRASKKNHWK